MCTKTYCVWKNGIKELISDVVERYNKINLNKLLEKESCDYETQAEFGTQLLCDKKYGELKMLYFDYEYLLFHGIIKANGKKEKKCEYEFWKSVTVSSSYISICLGFAFSLLGLLF